MPEVTLPDSLRDWLSDIFSGFPVHTRIEFWEQEHLDINYTEQTGAEQQTPEIRLKIHHPGVIRNLIHKRDPLVLMDAFLQGHVDLEGSVEKLTHFRHQQNSAENTEYPLSKLAKAWLQALTLPALPRETPSEGMKDELTTQAEAHEQERDQEAIQFHYDLSNDFYALWLDPRMVYSCAFFAEDELDLARAQEAKLDMICRKLRLQAGDKILDIGCGWGSLLNWAAQHYGAEAHGITLSQAQVDYNQDWIKQAGLESRIKVELLDYRDLPSRPSYDKIVSIGMVEHVGPENYPGYFQVALGALKPGGLFLNHGITTAEEGVDDTGGRFIDRYIFPDGELPRLSRLLTAAEDQGWEIVDVEALRPHYAKTLRAWHQNLVEHWPQVLQHISERRAKLWQLYLLGCAEAFEQDRVGISQTLLRRKQDQAWNLPMNRRHWM